MKVKFRIKSWSDTHFGKETKLASFKETAEVFYKLLNEYEVKEISVQRVKIEGKTYELPGFTSANNTHFYIQAISTED